MEKILWRFDSIWRIFNGGIEKIVYETPVRNRIGLQKAGTVYTSPAWSMNVVYARLKPGGPLKTLLLTRSSVFFDLAPGSCTGSACLGLRAEPQDQAITARQTSDNRRPIA